MKYSFLHLAALSIVLIASITTVTAVSAEERQCAQNDMKACFESEVDKLTAEEQMLIANTFERFSEEQKQSALNLFSENTGAKDAIAAVALENVPLGLHEAIIQEATANGADVELEIPGLAEALIVLQQTGDIDNVSYDIITEYAPTASVQLPIYIRSQAVQQRLVDAEKRLADAEGRLADAEGRLADAEGRLVDAEEELQDLKEISEQQDEILGEVSGN